MASVERFWSYVDTTGECWTWTAARDKDGYGQARAPGIKDRRAHRIAYILTFGPIPPGAMVLHSCDNPACVRPDHLRLGDGCDNMRDRSIRLRHNGEKHHHARLTAERVRRIRADYERMHSYHRVAALHDVAWITVRDVVKRRTWAHVA